MAGMCDKMKKQTGSLQKGRLRTGAIARTHNLIWIMPT